MEPTKNFVQLRGTAAGEPEPSHENHGQQFYRFPFAVRRLSGQKIGRASCRERV